jgi:hypothetical protein
MPIAMPSALNAAQAAAAQANRADRDHVAPAQL